MKDFLTTLIINFTRLNKNCNFYKLKRHLQEKGIFIDKMSLLKRLRYNE